MGSTTVYLALGARLSTKDIDIYSIDKWQADAAYLEKAKRCHNMDLELDSDILWMWEQNVAIFRDQKCKINGTKSDIAKFKYKAKQKISVYVDDICSSKKLCDRAFKTFSPYFIPHVTVLFLMDYYFYERDKPQFNYQRDLMAANKDVFFHLGRCNNTQTAIFVYLGGQIKFVTGDYNA
jgi:hypothetical protein